MESGLEKQIIEGILRAEALQDRSNHQYIEPRPIGKIVKLPQIILWYVPKT